MDTTTTESIADTGRVVIDWFHNNVDALIGIIVILLIATIATKLISEIFAKLLGRTIREDMYPSRTDRDRRLRTLTSISTAIVTFAVWTIAILKENLVMYCGICLPCQLILVLV